MTDVWLRKNIRDDVADDVYGSDILYWEADEVYGVINGTITEREVNARFAELWNLFEEQSARPAYVASRNVYDGELFVAGGDLFKAICNIPRGALLIEGMNVTGTSFEEQVNLLKEEGE